MSQTLRIFGSHLSGPGSKNEKNEKKVENGQRKRGSCVGRLAEEQQ